MYRRDAIRRALEIGSIIYIGKPVGADARGLESH